MKQALADSPDCLGKTKPTALVLVLAALTFILHSLLVWLKPLAISSVDLNNFIVQARDLLQGINPYISTNTINYPPFWLQWLYAVAKLSEYFGVPLQRVILLLLVAFESVLVWHLGQLSLDLGVSFRTVGKLLVFGVLLNPVMISQVCIHGHFDVLVALWIVLAIRFLLYSLSGGEAKEGGANDSFWLLSALCLGLGILTKTVPALLLPFLAIGAQGRSRLNLALGAYLVLMPAAIGLSVIYVLAPDAVATNVFGYRSIPGYFGWTGLVALLHKPWMLTLYTALSSLAMVVFMALLASRLSTDKKPITPYRLVSLVTLAMMFPIIWGSGFGRQYVMWFFPLLLVVIGVAERRQAQRLGLAAGLIAMHYLWEYAGLVLEGTGVDAAAGRGVFPGERVLSIFSTAAYSPADALMHAIWLGRVPLFMVMTWVWSELVVKELEGTS